MVINGDILTDIDLYKAIDFHQCHKGPVTLILHDYPEFNQIAVDAQGRVLDFRQEKGKGWPLPVYTSWIRDIFNFLPPSGSFDIIPIYQQMIEEGITDLGLCQSRSLLAGYRNTPVLSQSA